MTGEIRLRGCIPEPLGNYLKGLGVFRLLASQKDPEARAWWEQGCLHLWSKEITGMDQLADWLLAECQFTEPVSPWQKDTGYLPIGKRDKGAKARQHILKEFRHRFRAAPEVEQVLQSELEGSNVADSAWINRINEKDDTDAQAALHAYLRRSLTNDDALDWLDAVAAPEPADRGERRPQWFQLLGTSGGGEASGQYVSNYFQRLSTVLSDDREISRRRLLAALDARNDVGLYEDNALAAMYYPFLIESPNSGQKFERRKQVNPWDFVLLMEGTLIWASATTRRLSVTRQIASFPFYCATSLGARGAGPKEVEESENSIARGELWCPLWNRPASFREIRLLFSEGRVQLHGRAAERATEFARGVSSLGADRGISEFVRYSLLRRSGSGKNTTLLAIPLERRVPVHLPHLDLLQELDVFMRQVERGVRPSSILPQRLLTSRERTERAVFAATELLDKREMSAQLLDVLIQASNLERELAVTDGTVKAKGGQGTTNRSIRPIPSLSNRWFSLNDSVEFRLARAVASIIAIQDLSDSSELSAVALRSNLLPVIRTSSGWEWTKYASGIAEKRRSNVWSNSRSLTQNLAIVLQRRLIDMGSRIDVGLPLWSPFGADFSDLLRFWRREIDERRLSDLIHALSLVDSGTWTVKEIDAARQTKSDSTPELHGSAVWFDGGGQPHLGSTVQGAAHEELQAAFELPPIYALLKLCFVGGRLPARPREGQSNARDGSEPFPRASPEILSLLLSGRATDAVNAAVRRVRGKGYPAIVSGEMHVTREECRRIAGMLLFPVARAGILAARSIKPVPRRRGE